MIHKLVVMLIIFTSCTVQSQDVWPDKTRLLPELLRKVPVALYIQHGPNPNYPELNNTGQNKQQKYVWKHETTVCSPTQELTVFEAGSFIWYDESGWKENTQYSKADFKKRFECPNAILKKGACFTYTENFRWGSQLYGGDALWYVLAKDKEGNIYKGIGLIETEETLN